MSCAPAKRIGICFSVATALQKSPLKFDSGLYSISAVFAALPAVEETESPGDIKVVAPRFTVLPFVLISGEARGWGLSSRRTFASRCSCWGFERRGVARMKALP